MPATRHGKLACFIVTPLEHRNQRNRFLIVLSEIRLHLFGEWRKPRPISAARGRVSDLRLEAFVSGSILPSLTLAAAE
jgi:hypothetical protein